MANETITGCVKEDGSIEFFQDPDCIYSGCLVKSGVHAEQVAVTVNMAVCDDTYYGCVDKATGEFQVSVPEECCDWGEEGKENCPCHDCEPGEGGLGIQPKYIDVTLSGLIVQPDKVGCTNYIPGFPDYSFYITELNPILETFNKTWHLEHVSGCEWEATSADTDIFSTRYVGLDCVTFDFYVTYHSTKVKLRIVGSTMYIYAKFKFSVSENYYCWFCSSTSLGSGIELCVPEGTYDNEHHGVGGCPVGEFFSSYAGHVGQAVVSIPGGNVNLCTD